MSARDRILARVANALGPEPRQDAAPVPPEVAENIVRQISPEDKEALAQRFVSKVSALGDRAIMADSPEQAARALLAELANMDAKTIAASGEALQLLGNCLREADIEIYTPGSREECFHADVGLTLARYGVAETGTVYEEAGPGRARLASLAPPVHVALLPMSRLLPDLLDLIRHQRNASTSSAVCITGSSRTADIEGILVRGVHGPAKLLVILINEA